MKVSISFALLVGACVGDDSLPKPIAFDQPDLSVEQAGVGDEVDGELQQQEVSLGSLGQQAFPAIRGRSP